MVHGRLVHVLAKVLIDALLHLDIVIDLNVAIAEVNLNFPLSQVVLQVSVISIQGWQALL